MYKLAGNVPMSPTPNIAGQRSGFEHFLQTTVPFSSWAQGTIRQWVAEAHPVMGGPGETLQHTGEPATAVYLLTEGTLDLMTVIGSGAWHGVARCYPGSLLGLHPAFLSEAQVRKQTWVASTSVILWAVPNRVPASCFWTDEALSRTVLAVLAGTINLLIDEVGYAALLSTHSKVARRILSLSMPPSNLGFKPAGPLMLTQATLAEMLGLSRQGVNAALKELENKNIIRVSRYRIEVLSVAGLVQASDDRGD